MIYKYEEKNLSLGYSVDKNLKLADANAEGFYPMVNLPICYPWASVVDANLPINKENNQNILIM
jgi:hypothetical protein